MPSYVLLHVQAIIFFNPSFKLQKNRRGCLLVVKTEVIHLLDDNFKKGKIFENNNLEQVAGLQ